MKLFVEITDPCRKDAQLHSCLKIIERQKIRTENEGDSSVAQLFDLFPYNYRALKPIKWNLRLIAYEKVMTVNNEDVKVIVFLHIFKKDSNEYKELSKGPVPPKEEKFHSITGYYRVDWNNIQQKIENRLIIPPEPVPEKEPLSDEESAFLRDDTKLDHVFEIPIYESAEWIQSTKRNGFNDWFKVASALENHIVLLAKPTEYGLIEIPYGDRDEKILAYRFVGSDVYFLLGLGQEEKLKEFKEKWDKFLQENKIDLSTLEGKNAVIRTCRRAFPLSMLEDKDFWKEMEEDLRSNFHLSEEEMKIVSEKKEFPLFINGRAGSGKSTVLQYLFAEYLLRFLSHQEVDPPIYLSYSPNLIESAKSLSKSLFGKNHAYIKKLRESKKDITDIEPYFSQTFSVFQELIRSLINKKNKDILLQRFTRGEKYINYAKFRKMWLNKFGKTPSAKKEFGPAISWHVIRSYIKGWDSECLCDVEKYKTIGTNNQTVSLQTFESIYEKVWENWYCPLQEKGGLWDDQDLVRYCLTPDDDSAETYVEPKFSAVFCDESQDFTRVELDFILRLSVFSQRKIYEENTLKQLPFVFAGDEFQTLNPTGFSWDMLRSYFTERLIHSTDFKAKHGAPDPVSLTKNYRSTGPIVKLGNRLQLLRQVRFGGDTEIAPQSPNFSDQQAASVYCLSPDEDQIWKKLKEIEAMLIIPSDDGESAKDYIEKSPIKDKIEFYEDGPFKGKSKGITICNPLQAKGLEYPYVAVYGFGHNEELSLSKLKRYFANPVPSKDGEIELKYFLNNAYVSITRAQKQLFIIDDCASANGQKSSFWNFALSDTDKRMQKDAEELQEQMLSKIRNRERWGEGNESLGHILKGTIADVTGDAVLNPGEIAKKTEEQGLSLQNSDLMRQAVARYRERGQKIDALRCEAYAELFDENYLQAGNKFKEVKHFDDAIRCYFKVLTKPEESANALQALWSLYRERKDCIEVTAANLVKKDHPDIADNNKLLHSLKEILAGNDSKRKDEILENISAWQWILDRILPKIQTSGLVTAEAKKKLRVTVDLCGELADNGLTFNLDYQAEWLYAVGETTKAVDLWDELVRQGKSTQNESYYRAKIANSSYPENLKYWIHIANYESEVIAKYRQEKKTDLTNEQRLIVAQSALKAGNNEERKLFLPELLAGEINSGKAREHFDIAVKRDEFIRQNQDAVAALIHCRFRETVAKKLMDNLNATEQTRELRDMLAAIEEVRSQGFREYLEHAIREKNQKIIDIMNGKFGKFTRSIWNQPLFTEIGAVMEKRGHFLDALRYYQWAEGQTDEPVFKKELTLRWIACKERQAEHDNSAEYWGEAKAKRTEKKIDVDLELPLEPSFTRWQPFFERVLSFTPATQTQTHETDEPVQAEPELPESVRGVSTEAVTEIVGTAKPDKLFDISLFGYSFRFNPAKFELIIAVQTEGEDLRVKIKGGHFPEDSDFRLEDGQLKKESGEATPFRMNLSHSIVVVHNESGVQLMFPNPSPTARQKTIIKNAVKEMFAKPH